MSISVKFIPVESPEYPLPADYRDLTNDGQRQARVNACRQWLLPSISDEWRGWFFAQSIAFFNKAYLVASESYEPMFYDMPPCDDAPFFETVRTSLGTYKANMFVFPRGYAKSTVAEQATLVRTIACPLYSTLYVTNIHRNAKKRGARLRFQCYNNKVLEEDWGKEYGSPLKPPRGEQSSGVDHFVLCNGSEIMCASVDSEIRGLRPRRAVIDDPEADEAETTSMTNKREQMDRLVNKLVVPMVLRPNAGVDYFATFISKRHFAWKAMQTRIVGGLEVAADPRFEFWNRMFVPAAVPSEQGLISTWPAMYPATEAEITSDPIRLKGATSLEKTKALMGDRAFNAEMMGRPADSGSAFLPLLTEERHGWWIKGADDALTANPRQSKALFCYHMPDGTLVETPLPKFLQQVRLFMHCDYAYTHHANSDYKACGVFAFLRGPGLRFCLDMWAAQCVPNLFTRAILTMADRWKVPLVYVEAIREGYTLYDDLRSLISTRAATKLGITHFPKIVKQPKTMAAKTDRIAALAPIFEHNLFKFPLYLRGQPAWAMLFRQIEEFAPEAKDGGLANDDCLDLCAMTRDVIAGHIPKSQADAPVNPLDPIENIKRGNYTTKDGTPYAHVLDLSTIPAPLILEIVNVSRRKHPARSRA